MPAGKMVLAVRGRKGYSRYGRTARYGRMVQPYRYVAQRRKPMYKRVEFKTIETDEDATSVIDSTGEVNLLNGMSQGTDNFERIGRRVTLKSIELHMTAKATAATGLRQKALAFLVLDKHPNGATPAITDMLTISNVLALRNLDNRDRFVFLRRWEFQLTPDTQNQSIKGFKYYKRMNTQMTFDDSNNGDITDIRSGALFLVTLGENAAGDTAGTMNFRYRIRFLDD